MQAVKDGQRQGGALTIKHTAARKGKGPTGKPGPPGSDLERKVVNCLSCGKVFDFRLAGAGQLTNDLLRFLGQLVTTTPASLYCIAAKEEMLSWYSTDDIQKVHLHLAHLEVKPSALLHKLRHCMGARHIDEFGLVLDQLGSLVLKVDFYFALCYRVVTCVMYMCSQQHWHSRLCQCCSGALSLL